MKAFDDVAGAVYLFEEVIYMLLPGCQTDVPNRVNVPFRRCLMIEGFTFEGRTARQATCCFSSDSNVNSRSVRLV